jgi:hypothetical protein
LKKQELEGTRGWMPMGDGRGCGDLLSDKEMYLRVAVLYIYTPHAYHIICLDILDGLCI